MNSRPTTRTDDNGENNDRRSESEEKGQETSNDNRGGQQERAQLFNKLAAYELHFAYLLFESFGRQELCYSFYQPKRRSLTIPTVIRSTENKIHSPPPHEEPSIKQREDSRLNILPPL